MDRPFLRRWLDAIEQPRLMCPFCNELACGPDHSACMAMWSSCLALAYPVETDYPDDGEHGRRFLPLPCSVVSREARVNVLATRFDHFEQLWHTDDLCQMPDLAGLSLEVVRLANGAIEEEGVYLG